MKNGWSEVKKWSIFCYFFLLFFSCKSNKALLSGELDENLTTKAIVRNHYNGELNFKTLSGRMKIDYSDGDSSQGVNVTLRIEKDKTIWISAPLGMVKALITPTRVTFYNKLENEYFDGDFSYLSQILGAELNYEKVQNVLLGQAIFDLRDGKHTVELGNGNYLLKPLKSNELFKVLFEIEPEHFRMGTLVLAQPVMKRLLEIKYKNYQRVAKQIAPGEIEIVATHEDSQSKITMEFKNLEINKPLTFPYNIPKGFKEVTLK